MKPRVYRFQFDKGVPVFDWPTGKTVTRHKWRRGEKRVAAHSLIEAVRKLTAPVLKQYGAHAKLNVTRGFYTEDGGKNWIEVSLESVMASGFMVGALERT